MAHRSQRGRDDEDRSAEAAPGYFVWIRGLHGPEPQKWASLDFGLHGWKREIVLAYRKLEAEERAAPLSVLARRYPPPPREEA